MFKKKLGIALWTLVMDFFLSNKEEKVVLSLSLGSMKLDKKEPFDVFSFHVQT